MSLKKILIAALILVPTAAVYAAKTAPSKAPASTPELIAKGQALYKTNCSVCHGDKGDGKGPAGASLMPKARDFVNEKFKLGSKPEQVFKSITEGSKNTSMTAFGHLPEEDRWALTYYVLSFVKK